MTRMTKQQRRNLNVLSGDAIKSDKPVVEPDTVRKVFWQEWQALNDQLSVEQSYAIQDEMDEVATTAEKLMIVRNWRGRLETAKSKAQTELEQAKRQLANGWYNHKMPMGDRNLYRLIREKRVAEAQAKLNELKG